MEEHVLCHKYTQYSARVRLAIRVCSCSKLPSHFSSISTYQLEVPLTDIV